jgi:hypothetical protein
MLSEWEITEETTESYSSSKPVRMHSMSSSSSSGRPAAAISSLRERIFPMYSVTVIAPLQVVARAKRVFTARARVFDANIISMVAQASAAVGLAATWVNISLEIDAGM